MIQIKCCLLFFKAKFNAHVVFPNKISHAIIII